VRSRLFSPLGLLRCGWDIVVPSRPPDGDVSVGAIVRARLGRQVLEQIVDPLLGGVHAGRCDELSVRAVAPQLVSALATGKGLVRGLRASAAPAPAAPFATVRGGLGSLVTALAARGRGAGVSVHTGALVADVRPNRSGRVVVVERNGDAVEAAACIVATPAATAARLLSRVAPAAAAEIAGVLSAPATVVALAYPAAALARLPAATGFVTAGDDRLVRACTWSSLKWEHLGGDPAIVKAFVRDGGARAPTVADGELARTVHAELVLAMGALPPPVAARVHRSRAGIPQYAVGHLDRVDRIHAALPPPVAVAGAWNRGAGVGACVRSGRVAAERVLSHLDATARSHA
jgi:protoporphyrinogen/coproporphyrinogen III oxidase